MNNKIIMLPVIAIVFGLAIAQINIDAHAQDKKPIVTYDGSKKPVTEKEKDAKIANDEVENAYKDLVIATQQQQANTDAILIPLNQKVSEAINRARTVQGLPDNYQYNMQLHRFELPKITAPDGTAVKTNPEQKPTEPVKPVETKPEPKK